MLNKMHTKKLKLALLSMLAITSSVKKKPAKKNTVTKSTNNTKALYILLDVFVAAGVVGSMRCAWHRQRRIKARVSKQI